MSGTLNLVSVGPGFSEHITAAAAEALTDSGVIVGLDLYFTWIEHLIYGKEKITTALTQERQRVLAALEQARCGKKVALLSSGDIGVYAMASLAFDEMREDDIFSLNIIPGITAANACASLLGAPLSHDFATLSLSDHLCPWEWIEERARHIAQADLTAALYNVQSKQRPAGIYRILEIFKAYKTSDTVCGIVRNAYRPEQNMEICSLSELPARQFDMMTTIIIGNRFTRRKRNWIYTPRGYNNWGEDAHAPRPLPRSAVWVFSGTSDGNAIANTISASGRAVVVSAATAYGGSIAAKDCPDVHVLAGRSGKESRRKDLSASAAAAIVDATHPYACRISSQLMELASELDIPYVRFERPPLAQAGYARICDSVDDAALQAMNLGKRIFLATGSKDLECILSAPDAADYQWFARVTPDAESIDKAIKCGIPREHILAMQGPFSRELNEALWHQWQIDCVITKDSGTAGGYEQKLNAAKALSIPLIVVRRPVLQYPRLVCDLPSLIKQLNDLELAQ